jgi:hypothetical protein
VARHRKALPQGLKKAKNLLATTKINLHTIRQHNKKSDTVF